MKDKNIPICKYCDNDCIVDHEKIYEFNIFGFRILIFNPYKYEYLDVCEDCYFNLEQSKNDDIYDQIYMNGFNDGIEKCRY